jgi:hypothetical protein
MGVPTSEVGYTFATARGQTTKFMRTCGGIGEEKKNPPLIIRITIIISL